MIIPRLRQGIGFDIEFNEDVCHVIRTEEGLSLFAYSGIILLLPFIKIYIGEFIEIGEVEDND